ncbi:MAG: ABC transporter ATP-binding protein [Nibricoccus sp.]
MRRFIPYFRYLKPVRWHLITAIACGILFGAANGAGLPLMMKLVFPVVFKEGTRALPERWDKKHLKKQLELTTEQLSRLDPLLHEAELKFQSGLDQRAAIDARLEQDFKALLTPEQLEKFSPKPLVSPKLTTLQLWLVALWLPGVFLVRGLSGYFNSYLIQFCGTRVLEAIRTDYFRKLQALPLAFFQRVSTGDLITRGLGDAAQLQNTITTLANEIVKQPASLCGALGFLIYLAFAERGIGLVLVTLAIVPVCVLPIRYVGKKMLQKAHQLQSEAGSITERFTENLAAVKEVRAFAMEETEVSRFSRLSHVMVRAQMKVAKYAQSLTPTIEVISAIGISITFVYVYQVGISLGSFLAIIGALFTCYDPIKKLGSLSNEIVRGEAALSRIEEVLNEPLSIKDPENPVPVDRLQGNITFEKVEFSYKADTPVLKNITTKIPAGTICALVGPSGAGKTTFANIVPRFYDVVQGAVTIDGIDTRQMRLADLRRNIAIVSQDPVLFNESIYHNILLGRPGATREEVEQAARDAFAHDFIVNQLPRGYDSVVGERGSQLSGGQKQRIALARAFLRNAPILILDEATSALDSESEAYIQKALKKLMAGKTALIIAHRFSTIRDASMILVFDKGHIVGAGPHNQLYRESPLYKTLFDGQSHAATTGEQS